MDGGRASGILLHPTSLPGGYGVGDLGPAAAAFVDWLRDAGQRLWQVLPLGPTGGGGSPYSGLSAFAGNPLLISPERLFEQGLVDRGALDGAAIPGATAVDFPRVARVKHALLRTAFARRDRDACAAFARTHRAWLDDWTLFRALVGRFGLPLDRWPAPLWRRRRRALAEARRELRDECAFHAFVQHCFWTQWDALRAHAHDRGVRLVGDVPFYVDASSADVWAHPWTFELNRFTRRPRVVGGVPPDLFSATGQRWGTPCYAWWTERLTGFAWWTARLAHLARAVDVVRVDHFRGFSACWQIPARAAEATRGRWVAAPGAALLAKVRRRLPDLELWAEDLGHVDAGVVALRDRFGVASTRVLQFAFDGGDDNGHLPAHHPEDAVVYTGTHDNDTTRGWWAALDADRRARVAEFVDAPTEADVHERLIELALGSRARACVVPLQDVLGLGTEARMNVPATTERNWSWRAPAGACTAERAAWLAAATRRSR